MPAVVVCGMGVGRRNADGDAGQHATGISAAHGLSVTHWDRGGADRGACSKQVIDVRMVTDAMQVFGVGSVLMLLLASAGVSVAVAMLWAHQL